MKQHYLYQKVFDQDPVGLISLQQCIHDNRVIYLVQEINEYSIDTFTFSCGQEAVEKMEELKSKVSGRIFAL